MATGIAVSAADPSGLWGTLREFYANSAALDAAKRDPHVNDLVRAVLADLDSDQGKERLQKGLHKRFAEATGPADVVRVSLATLKQTAAILDEREPADAAAFKDWLFGVSEKVAEAASEGGFLGIGGYLACDKTAGKRCQRKAFRGFGHAGKSFLAEAALKLRQSAFDLRELGDCGSDAEQKRTACGRDAAGDDHRPAAFD